MDTATSLTILLAAFAGGAISTAFAEWIRAASQARRERRNLLLSLREEVSAWLNSQDDWLVRGQNETLGESPIPMRTPSTVLDSGLLQSARYSSLRGTIVEAARAVGMYNSKMEFARLRQVQDWGTGRNLRAEAGKYVDQKVIPGLQRVLMELNRVR